MEEKRETFSYTYSSAQQSEVEKIREKYIAPPKEQDKLEQLRRLDESVTKPGMIVSLLVGIVSTLIMGVGMCCCMVWKGVFFIPGVIIGIVGILGICTAYPLYVHITRKQREKLAPEIIRLSDELLK